MKNRFLFLSIIFLSLFLLNSCSVYETFENFARLQFKISSYNNFRVADVPLKGKEDLEDFKTMDYVKLTGAFIKGKFPFSFIINVEAKNPNDGEGGFPATDLSVESFPFRVLLDDKEVFTGNIDEPFYVPGKGENKIIPFRINFDIIQFFKDKNFEEAADLVLAVGGQDGSRSRITLKAQPVIGTPVGKFEYPEEITINRDF